MAYRIELVEDAKADLLALRKTDRVKVLDRIEQHLRRQPTFQSRSRIKALRPGTFPPFRLRVDEFRVYYDVDESEKFIIVYGILAKSQSEAWLAQHTKRHQKGEKP